MALIPSDYQVMPVDYPMIPISLDDETPIHPDHKDIVQETVRWLRESGDQDLPPRWVRMGALGSTMAAAVASICLSGQGLVSNTLASMQSKFTSAELQNYSTRLQYLAIAAGIGSGYIFDTTILKRGYLDGKALVATMLFSELLIKNSAKRLKTLMRPPKGKKTDLLLSQSEDLEAEREIQQLAKIAIEAQSLSGPIASGSKDPIAQYLLESEGKRPSKTVRWGVLASAEIASILLVLGSGQGIASTAASRVLERLGKGEIKDLSVKAQLTAITVYLAVALAFDMLVLKRSFTQPKDWVAAALALSFDLGFLARLSKRVIDPNMKVKVSKPISLSGQEGDASCQCSLGDWRTWVYKRTSGGKLPHLVRAAILGAITSATVTSNVVLGQGLASKTLSTFSSRVFRTETREWGKKLLYTALLTYIVTSLIFDVFALGKNPLNFGTLAALPLALDLFIKIGIRHLELLLNPKAVDDDDDDEDEQVEKMPKEKKDKKITPEVTELTNLMDELTISSPPSSVSDSPIVLAVAVPVSISGAVNEM